MKKLEVAFAQLEREGLLSIWHAGSDELNVSQEVKARLERA